VERQNQSQIFTSVFIYRIQMEPQLEGMGSIPRSTFLPKQAPS